MQGTQLDHVTKGTLFSLVGILVTIQTVALGSTYAVITQRQNDFQAQTTAQFDQVNKRITTMEDRVESVDKDIRAILVGIEQVKARLGIIENTEH